MKFNNRKIHDRKLHAKVADAETAGLSVTKTAPPARTLVSSAVSSHLSHRFLLPLLSCAVPGAAFAAPENGTVIAGSANISNPDANTTLITQHSSSAAINWQRFNIDSHEYVQFAQPDSNSVALNRVIGGDPSQILGNLSANGQVFLVNPNGVYFGQHSTIDVGGIVASVRDIDTNDFMAGNYVFSKTLGAPDDVGIVNDGLITARDGGYVVMMGDYVHNNGIISARMGTVALAAGNAITMDVKGNGLVSIAVDEETFSDVAGVENAGQIMAAGGRVMMTSKVANDLIDTAINNEGLVVANSITERNGVIFLTASGGDVVNTGTLDASAEAGSDVDGGGVLVYSDKDVTLASGAVISAAGDGDGDGGAVRVIAEDRLDFQSGAKIEVTSESGDGGFVEVSGHGSLALRGTVEIGDGGSLQIDPAVLTIRAGGGAPDVTSSFASVGETFIETQLNTGVDVTLVASNTIGATTGSGDIVIDSVDPAADLSIKIGTLAVTGTGGSLSGGAFNCGSAGFCIGGGSSVTFTPDANGTINLSNVSFNLAGGLNVAGGTNNGDVRLNNIAAAGSVNITAGSAATADVIINQSIDAGGQLNVDAGGRITLGSSSFSGHVAAGGNISLTARRNINIYNTVTNAGASFLASVNGIGDSSVNIYGGVGSAGSRLNTDVSLRATRDVNIESDIFLANNTLTLVADTNLNSSGDVNIVPAFGSCCIFDQGYKVNTLGSITINAQNLSIVGADGSGISSGTVNKPRTEVHADNNITITVADLVRIEGGNSGSFGSGLSGNFDASAVLSAGNDISITAGALDVLGGSGVYNVNTPTPSASPVTGKFNAEINAGRDVLLSVNTGNLTVRGGSVDVNASADTFGGFGGGVNAAMTADATITAGNQVRINNVNGSLNVEGGSASALALANVLCSPSCGTSASGPNATAVASADASIIGGSVLITNVTGGIAVNGGPAFPSSTFSPGSVRANAIANSSAGVVAVAKATSQADALISGNTVTISQDSSISSTGGLFITGGFATTSNGGLGGVESAGASAKAGIDAAGNITINVADSVSLGSSESSGTAYLSAGGIASITAGAFSNININGSLMAGSQLILDAGNAINLNQGLGTSASRFAADVSMTARAVNIDADIYLANNTLTLTGSDGFSSGQVRVQNGVVESRTVSTLGNLIIRGDNLIVAGVLTNQFADSAINIDAGYIDIDVKQGVTINGTSGANFDNPGFIAASGALDMSVNIKSASDIDIAAAYLQVNAGDIKYDVTSGAGSVSLNADVVIDAAGDITIGLDSYMAVEGGTVLVDVGSAASFVNVTAHADALLNAAGAINVTANSADLFSGPISSINGGSGVVDVSAKSEVLASNITLALTGTLSASNALVSATSSVDITAANYGIGGSSVTFFGNSLAFRSPVDLYLSSLAGHFSAGSALSFSAAAGALRMDTNLGSSAAARLDNDVTLAGKNIYINNNVYLASNNLTITGQSGSSDLIGISGSVGNMVHVDTLGNITITGNDLVVKDYSVIGGSAVTAGSVGVAASNIDVTLAGAMKIEAGSLTRFNSSFGSGTNNSFSANASVKASNNINITAASLSIVGGNATAVAAFGSNDITVNANATLEASGDITLDIGNKLMVSAGSANASIGPSTSGLGSISMTADANAAIKAGGNLSVTAGSVELAGGADAAGSATGVTAVANALASLQADNIVLNVSGLMDANSATISAVTDVDVSAGTYLENINHTTLAGSSLSVFSVTDYVVNGIYSASVYSFAAGNNLDVNTTFGTSGSAINGDLNLSAANNVSLNNSINLGNNSLNITADNDNSGTGDVNISGVLINTLGALNVSGQNINGFSASIGAAGLDVTANGDLLIDNTDISVSGNVSYLAGGNITQNGGIVLAGGALLANAGGSMTLNSSAAGSGASGMTLTAGLDINLNIDFGSTTLRYNEAATLSAGNDININGDIYFGSNVLTLIADNDLSGAGDINLSSTTVVDVLGDLSLSAVKVSAASADLNLIIGNNLDLYVDAFDAGGSNITLQAGSDISINPVTGGVTAFNKDALVSAGNSIFIDNDVAATNNLTLTADDDSSGAGDVYTGAGISVDVTNDLIVNAVNVGAVDNLQMSAGNDLTVNAGDISASGSSITLSAGNDLHMNADIGSSTSREASKTTLAAANNVNLNNDIYLASNTLDIIADNDTSGIGDVNVNPVTIDTLGTLNISGANINDPSANITVATLNADATGNIFIENTNVTVSGEAAYVAGGDIVQDGGRVEAAILSMTAGGSLSFNSSAEVAGATSVTLLANNVNISGSTDLTPVFDVSGLLAISGTNLNVSQANINAGVLKTEMTGDILSANAAYDVGAVYMSAAGNIDLSASTISVGSGTVAGIEGDTLALAFMQSKGIPAPTTPNPNAKFVSGGTLDLGQVTMFGDVPYLWIKADATTFEGLVLPEASDVLVQYSPFTVSKTITVEAEPDPDANSAFVNYNNLQHFSILPGTTVLIGSSLHTGDITIGNLASVDIGDKNFVAVTSESIDSITNVISTGIVAELIVGQIIKIDEEFVTPALSEVEVPLESSEKSAEEEKEKRKKLVKDEEDESINMCEAV